MANWKELAKAALLADGEIDNRETKWLRKVIMADGKVDKDEIKLLKDLKAEATKVGTEFNKLYNECVK